MTTLDCYWYSKYRFNSSRSPDTERNGRVALCSSQKPIYILFNKLIFALINYKIDRFIINKNRKRVFELQLQISERDSSLFKFSSIFHYLNFHERFPFYPIHINKSRSFVPSNEEVSNSSNFFFPPFSSLFFFYDAVILAVEVTGEQKIRLLYYTRRNLNSCNENLLRHFTAPERYKKLDTGNKK